LKIKVVHDECGREVLVRQILETGGHCPWDGKAFNKDYTAILAEALEAAENHGGVLENALEKIADMHPKLTLDRNSILGPIDAHIDRLNRDGDNR
jgi:hypothetical protein